MDASSGDLVLTPSDRTVVIGVPAIDITDASIRAQVRIEEGSIPSPGGDDFFFSGRSSVELIARGDRTTGHAYLGGMFDNGEIYINRVWGPRQPLATADTDLRPLDEDVILQFDVIGTTLSMWAWRPGEPIPSQPQIMISNADLAHGEVGINFTAVAGDPMPGHATYRRVQVANTHIPEPSSASIVAMAIVAGLIWRGKTRRIARRRSRTTSRNWRFLYLAGVLWFIASARSLAQFTTVINVPPDSPPASIGSGTQLNVLEGGAVPSSFDHPFQSGLPDGSSTNIVINVSGGTVGPYFDANSGSVVNISSGAIEGDFRASGSQVNVFGGSVADLSASQSEILVSGGRVSALRTFYSEIDVSGGVLQFAESWGGVTNVSGGDIGFLSAGSYDGTLAEVSISGGSFRRLATNGSLTIAGGEFRFNGVQIEDQTTGGSRRVQFPASPGLGWPNTVDGLGTLLSGVLADGTPFALLQQDWFSGLEFFDGLPPSITLQFALLPPVGAQLITASVEGVPWGIRDGQTLVVDTPAAAAARLNAGRGSKVLVQEGGVLPSLVVADAAEVKVSGGMVDGIRAFDSPVDIEAGNVGHIQAVRGSQVAITGGAAEIVSAFPGGQVAIQGGSVTNELKTFGGQVIITGGDVAGVHGGYNGEVTIAGGSVGWMGAHHGSHWKLYGTEFSLDGNDLADLAPGTPFTVGARDVELAATLADGSVFRLDLNSTDSGPSFFPPDATLQVTLVSQRLGDFNSNGAVEQADLDLVLLKWGDELFNPFADGWINDLPVGPIDQEELDTVLLNWGSVVAVGTTSVPEPSAVTMLLIGVALFAAFADRRVCSLRRL
jgi:hypothetical protein